MLRDREPLPTRVLDTPGLPAEYDAVLDEGLAAIGLQLEASVRETIAGHVRLLLAWTRAINLTSIRDPGAVAREHVLDSLAALPVLRERGATRLLDLGSGGGFPGLPLAIELGCDALLVDSIAKKTRFLETVATAIGIPRILVATARAETLGEDPANRERWPVVVTRAVARLTSLAEIGLPLVSPAGVLVAWKRQPVEAEIAEAASSIRLFGGGRIDVLPTGVPGLEDHVLVVVEKQRPSPPMARRRRSRDRSQRRSRGDQDESLPAGRRIAAP